MTLEELERKKKELQLQAEVKALERKNTAWSVATSKWTIGGVALFGLIFVADGSYTKLYVGLTCWFLAGILFTLRSKK